MEKVVLLYYKYITVPNPTLEVKEHKEYCQSLGLLGRVLIGKEGINGTLEGTKEAVESYKNYLNKHKLFSDIVFKESFTDIPAFTKLKIKERDEIVALNKEVDLNKAGTKISPENLHQILENGEDVILVDMRNSYESNIGRFRNAIAVATKNFRDLPEKIENLRKYQDKKIITYCTGGIRCEKASSLLIEEGFKDVYQLDGGIFKYGEKYPEGYFDGKCFVFDQRMSIAFSKNPAILTKCEHCQQASSDYTDCADDSCHRLFVSCESCKAKYNNFCTQEHFNLA